jgi:hypothetical protein
MCLQHIEQIKDELGISGVGAHISQFRNENTQVDLVIDRNDNIINLCEIKYDNQALVIDKDYFEYLDKMKKEFIRVTKTRKPMVLTMVSFKGVDINSYSGNVPYKISATDFLIEK